MSTISFLSFVFIYLFIPTVSHPLSSTCSSPAGFHQFTVGVDSLLLSYRKHKFESFAHLVESLSSVTAAQLQEQQANQSEECLSAADWVRLISSRQPQLKGSIDPKLSRCCTLQVWNLFLKGRLAKRKVFSTLVDSGCSDVFVLLVTVVVLMDSKNTTQAWNTVSEKWYLN